MDNSNEPTMFGTIKKECCKNCKFFHKLKIANRDQNKFDLFEITSCCIALTRVNDSKDDCDDYNSFVIETNENSRCEMFTERK